MAVHKRRSHLQHVRLAPRVDRPVGQHEHLLHSQVQRRRVNREGREWRVDAEPTRSDIRSLLGAPRGRHGTVTALTSAEGGGPLEH